jgi:hypothetical protein
MAFTIINRETTKGNSNLYKKIGNKAFMQHHYGDLPAKVMDLFIELTGDAQFWKAEHHKRFKEFVHKYPDCSQVEGIYLAGVGVDPNYWRANSYLKLKEWGRMACGWDLFDYKGVCK